MPYGRGPDPGVGGHARPGAVHLRRPPNSSTDWSSPATLALLGVILAVGWKLRNQIIVWLTLAQIAGLAFLDFFLTGHASPGPTIYVDDLSLSWWPSSP